MTHSSALERLVRESRTGERMFGAAALLVGVTGVLVVRWHSVGWYVMGGIHFAFALLCVFLSWNSRRSSRAVARAVRSGRTAPVQMTLSRRTAADEDPEYFVRVERDGYSPDVKVWVSLAGWDESQPCGVPLPGTAYLGDDGHWIAIETAHGVVHR